MSFVINISATKMTRGPTSSNDLPMLVTSRGVATATHLAPGERGVLVRLRCSALRTLAYRAGTINV